MKIIYMNCNYKSSWRKQNSKKIKKYVENPMKAMANLTDEQFEELNMNIKKSMEEISLDNINTIKDMVLIERCKNKNLHFNLEPMLEDTKFVEVENKTSTNRFKTLLNTVKDKVIELSGSKKLRIVLQISIAIVFLLMNILLLNMNSMAAVACFAQGSSWNATVDKVYGFIKAIGALLVFIYMAIEVVQKGVKSGDTRAIWSIVAKYTSILVVLFAYRSVVEWLERFFLEF